MNKLWKLSSFDLFCLGMNNKGAWIYNETIDFEKMKSALETLAKTYPILSGHFDEKVKSVVWDDASSPELPFQKKDLSDYSQSQLYGNARLAWSLVKPYDVKGFKKGAVPPFSATLGYLKDGCILYVQCAHATMDAHTFYSLISQWAELYKGNEIQPMTIDQSVVPSGESLSKEETLKRIQLKGWPLINFKKIVKMLISLFRNNAIKKTSVIEVSQDEIARLRAKSGVGTNAVLSAITLKKVAERIPEKKSFKMLFTTDLRGRIDGIDDSFFGNMSQPAVLDGEIPADADVAAIATLIANSLQAAMAPDALGENVCLYQCSSHYDLPYAPFDASDMNCPGNGTVIVNNFLKFKTNEMDWGMGMPTYTFPNELPDMIKFWQPVAGGPVQIIFGGYAAKLMKRE